LILPGEFDLIHPIYWVAATVVTVLFVVNSSDGGSTPETDPTPPLASPDGDDPDKWKRYLKWAAFAVGVIAGVAVVVYLARRVRTNFARPRGRYTRGGYPVGGYYLGSDGRTS